jgi:hypothetical protein
VGEVDQGELTRGGVSWMSVVAGNDERPESMAIGEDAGISDEADVWWRNESGELGQELLGAHDDATTLAREAVGVDEEMGHGRRRGGRRARGQRKLDTRRHGGVDVEVIGHVIGHTGLGEVRGHSLSDLEQVFGGERLDGMEADLRHRHALRRAPTADIPPRGAGR